VQCSPTATEAAPLLISSSLPQAANSLSPTQAVNLIGPAETAESLSPSQSAVPISPTQTSTPLFPSLQGANPRSTAPPPSARKKLKVKAVGNIPSEESAGGSSSHPISTSQGTAPPPTPARKKKAAVESLADSPKSSRPPGTAVGDNFIVRLEFVRRQTSNQISVGPEFLTVRVPVAATVLQLKQLVLAKLNNSVPKTVKNEADSAILSLVEESALLFIQLGPYYPLGLLDAAKVSMYLGDHSLRPSEGGSITLKHQLFLRFPYAALEKSEDLGEIPAAPPAILGRSTSLVVPPPPLAVSPRASSELAVFKSASDVRLHLRYAVSQLPQESLPLWQECKFDESSISIESVGGFFNENPVLSSFPRNTDSSVFYNFVDGGYWSAAVHAVNMVACRTLVGLTVIPDGEDDFLRRRVTCMAAVISFVDFILKPSWLPRGHKNSVTSLYLICSFPVVLFYLFSIPAVLFIFNSSRFIYFQFIIIQPFYLFSIHYNLNYRYKVAARDHQH
jgi:hypothetical protein